MKSLDQALDGLIEYHANKVVAEKLELLVGHWLDEAAREAISDNITEVTDIYARTRAYKERIESLKKKLERGLPL